MTPRKRAPSWSAIRQVQRYSNLRDLSVTYEGRSQDIATHPPDISPRGMFINTASRFPEGAVLKLKFRLSQSNVEVFARCEVRYCLPGVGVGVEFVEMPPEAARAIEKELRLADDVHPRRKRKA